MNSHDTKLPGTIHTEQPPHRFKLHKIFAGNGIQPWHCLHYFLRSTKNASNQKPNRCVDIRHDAERHRNNNKKKHRQYGKRNLCTISDESSRLTLTASLLCLAGLVCLRFDLTGPKHGLQHHYLHHRLCRGSITSRFMLSTVCEALEIHFLLTFHLSAAFFFLMLLSECSVQHKKQRLAAADQINPLLMHTSSSLPSFQ